MADDDIKRLMSHLGQSISETLSDSPKINESIQDIRNAGYEVCLIIEAKIGFNRKVQTDEESLSCPARSEEESTQLHITHDDANFLRSLKIAVDESS